MAKTEKDTREIAQAERARRRAMLSPFDEMDRMFENFMPRGWLSPMRRQMPELARVFEGYMPRVDVIDRDEDVLLRAELPGVDKKDLDITMTDNSVTISATTSYEKEEDEANYYRCEMSHGEFSRTVTLPAEVDDVKAKAKFDNGVLELVMPKRETAKRRSISVE